MTTRAAPLLVACLATACGLAPHDGAIDVVPDDGVSGFTDEGAVEVCVGARRIVADGASDVLSVCVADRATARACGAAVECGARERCLCGRCIVVACAGNADCAADEVCRSGTCGKACAADDACRTDEVCSFGRCARRCADDTACGFGERCGGSSRVCEARLCSSDAACGAGAHCEAETELAELREPFVVDGVAYAEVRRRGAGGAISASIARFVRASLTRWRAEPEAPVLSPGAGDADRVGAPSVVASPGRVDLWFASGAHAAISHAWSRDGVAFTRDADAVLTPRDAWEGGAVGSPAVVDVAGTRFLLFEAGAGADQGSPAGVGVAKLDASGTAARLAPTPWLGPAAFEDPERFRDVTSVGGPFALVDAHGTVRVFAHARGVEGGPARTFDADVPADPNESIVLVTTRDFGAFERAPVGPVYARRTTLRTYLGEREPSVALVDPLTGRASLVVVASDASGKLPAGLDVADDR